MKNLLNKLINPFMPAYEVVCTNYQIIPGLPVNKNQSTQYFDRGAGKEAKEFYSKVINSQFTRNLAPVEVHLRMAGITIKKTQIGPVKDLKQFKMAS
jgi:hypothetical protein